MKHLLLAICLANCFIAYSQSILDNRDQKLYFYVDMGGQQWLKDNLKYNMDYSYFYNHGTDQVYYNERSIKYDSLCPDGWKIPTLGDWEDAKEDLKLLSGKKRNGWVKSGQYDSKKSVYWALPSESEDSNLYLIEIDSSYSDFAVSKITKGVMASCKCVLDEE